MHLTKNYLFVWFLRKQYDIYTIEEVGELIRVLEKRLYLNNSNKEGEVDKYNQTLVYTSHFWGKLRNLLKKVYVYDLLKLLPRSVKNNINKCIYDDISDIREKILREPFIFDFIMGYYARDIEFYNRIKSDK